MHAPKKCMHCITVVCPHHTISQVTHSRSKPILWKNSSQREGLYRLLLCLLWRSQMISVYLSLRPQAGANTVTIGDSRLALIERL